MAMQDIKVCVKTVNQLPPGEREKVVGLLLEDMQPERIVDVLQQYKITPELREVADGIASTTR